MKKNKVQNIAIILVGMGIIGAIVGYNYSAEQTRQKGFEFGNELTRIQEDVAELQTKFYSEKIKWDEGDITKEELLKFYKGHVDEFEGLILRYDGLSVPELFKSSVELFKLSSETQLKSDVEYIEWIAEGDRSAKIRSDEQIQEAYEYENLALVEFQSAKTGRVEYSEKEKFSPPDNMIKQKVIEISDNMKNRCESAFRNVAGEFDSNEIEIEWYNCVNEAEEWKKEHLP